MTYSTISSLIISAKGDSFGEYRTVPTTTHELSAFSATKCTYLKICEAQAHQLLRSAHAEKAFAVEACRKILKTPPELRSDDDIIVIKKEIESLSFIAQVRTVNRSISVLEACTSTIQSYRPPLVH